MSGHAPRIGSFLGKELQHRQEEFTNLHTLFGVEVIFLSQNFGEGPMPKTMDVT